MPTRSRERYVSQNLSCKRPTKVAGNAHAHNCTGINVPDCAKRRQPRVISRTRAEAESRRSSLGGESNPLEGRTSYPFASAPNPLTSSVALTFTCSTSGSWRWDHYRDSNQIGLWWRTQPSDNEKIESYIVGTLGVHNIYILRMDSGWWKASGGGLTLANTATPVIISCDSLTGSDNSQGRGCIISTGCVTNVDINDPMPLRLGFGGCSKFSLESTGDQIASSDWLLVFPSGVAAAVVRSISEAVPIPSTLTSPNRLIAPQFLLAPAAQFVAIMRSDGNFVIYYNKSNLGQ
eukprot:c3848_g1_i1.p1 GENE.c3848_g1_i1~~c3848_g1_i1.p1  ORF type:complete len:291 (+),score=24.83 c3848_g1_i1:420-1292(+)